MSQTVSNLGEFGLINRITRDLPTSPAVSVGPGDDGAVFLVNGSVVSTVDMLVEDVHFKCSWCSGQDVGRKLVGANVADLEAMGAKPVALVAAVSLPKDLEESWVREFATGLRDEATLADASLVGGDIVTGEKIVVSLTAIGQTDGLQPILRSGARVGDVVAIRGRLGWSSAGLATLTRGFRSPRTVIEAYRYPQVPYGAGRQAALAGASAMIDISDGLLADLGHICQQSNVSIDIDAARLTIAEPVATVGAALNTNPLDYVLTGGEDHALAATFAVGNVPDEWDVIGVVEAPSEGSSVTVDGAAWQTENLGWTHF